MIRLLKSDVSMCAIFIALLQIAYGIALVWGDGNGLLWQSMHDFPDYAMWNNTMLLGGLYLLAVSVAGVRRYMRVGLSLSVFLWASMGAHVMYDWVLIPASLTIPIVAAMAFVTLLSTRSENS